MPVLKDSALYNCRVLLLNSQIVLIRPKTRLAMNGNYRESRWFTAWDDGPQGLMTWLSLPEFITQLNGQTRAPFGDKAVIELSLGSQSMASATTFRIGFEICEELWHSDAQHISLFGKRGCHLVFNSSASYWEIRKLNRALNLMRTATFKSGGIYAFANLVGCDGGGRLCFYGRSLVMINGDLIAMTTNADTMFDEIQTAVAFIDPNDVSQYRLQNNVRTKTHQSIGNNLVLDASRVGNYSDPKLDIASVVTINIVGFEVLVSSAGPRGAAQPIGDQLSLKAEQEIMIYCSLWLWDYLRRCIGRGLEGFVVPLSGGLDSSAVVCLVYSLCTLLYRQVINRNKAIIQYLKVLFKDEIIADKIQSPKDICNKILKCVYLSTRYSGRDSEDRARSLATSVNCQFITHNFDDVFQLLTGSVPLEGVEETQGVTLLQQNLQARLRMVLTYYLSQGKRLVLATGNVDEALVGYLTKYDCSSADLNPIGSISKNDLKSFMRFSKEFISDTNNAINRIVEAIPSAELTGEDQQDEQDLGLTYDELSLFGKLRRGQFGAYGPFGTFCKIWDERDSLHIRAAIKDLDETTRPEVIASKVKRFFALYATNRHKQTVLTPALHSETYSPDDNRFDHRQFLLDPTWKFQFRQIDLKVKKINENK